MKKNNVAIIQCFDQNLFDKKEDSETHNILLLNSNLMDWSKLHNYDHYTYYISNEYKSSKDFENKMYNEYTKIWIKNIGNINHSKFFSFIKTLELLESGVCDYVCVLDLDIGFVDINRNIDNYIKKLNLNNKSIIAGMECINEYEYFDGKVPNGGVLLFKKTPWTIRFLKGFILAQTRVGYSTHVISDCMVDQMQLSFALMVCPDCDHNFAIQKGYDNIQMWYDDNNYNTRLENNNAVFFHFAGGMKKNIPLYLNKLRESKLNVINSLEHYESKIKKF